MPNIYFFIPRIKLVLLNKGTNSESDWGRSISKIGPDR